ncbi:YaiO family outer membrane beta-barrel protein [Hydrogenophaga sp. RWCD_12]|uniref:YaiO family outer membrane beta-barrel protein n=1 Tax=Hydrogenophaga sp. RWCD_12 TaxID=3391190 RepID=UPI003984881F
MHTPMKLAASAAALGAFAALTLSLPVRAQSSLMEPSTTAPREPVMPSPEASAQPGATRTDLLLYTSAQHLTAGLGNWKEIGVRGSHTMGAHVLQGEAATMRRFGESGNFIGLGDTYSFDPDWFGSLSVGAGDGASYLPRARIDGFIHRKLLADRNLIASLGAAYYRAPDGHNDRSASLGATYYFSEPWILQGEVRFNNSRPGSVTTRQQFVALTWGRDQQTQITARHAWGREGYQTIGNGDALVDFSSHQSSLNLRHWLGADWGLAAGIERYHNPYYHRAGATLGLFWELP